MNQELEELSLELKSLKVDQEEFNNIIQQVHEKNTDKMPPKPKAPKYHHRCNFILPVYLSHIPLLSLAFIGTVLQNGDAAGSGIRYVKTSSLCLFIPFSS